MSSERLHLPRKVLLYRVSLRAAERSRRYLALLTTAVKSCVTGVWLGLLDADALRTVANSFYSENWRYADDGYNRSGLLTWEAAMVDRYFVGRRRLVLVGAGGGREVLALARRGYRVRGFECNRDLVATAATVLAGQSEEASVEYAPPDTCPAVDGPVDGLVVGWGAYMLIQGRSNRVALLRSMRAQVAYGAPLLTSFFVRTPTERRFAWIAAVANVIRGVRGCELVSVGDDLAPEYVHHFAREELADELADGGFALVHFAAEPYGHAVAIAS